MDKYNCDDIINIGTGEDISIKDVALLIKKIIGFEGSVIYDTTKPDGIPRKLLDVSKINNIGWRCQTSLEDCMEKTIKYFERVV